VLLIQPWSACALARAPLNYPRLPSMGIIEGESKSETSKPKPYGARNRKSESVSLLQ
jgi:hypothetical protein